MSVDHEFVLLLLSKGYNYCPNNLLLDRDFLVEAVKIDENILNESIVKSNEALMKDKEFLLDLIEKNYKVLDVI